MKPTMTIVGFGPMGKRFTNIFQNEFEVQISSTRNISQELANFKASYVKDRESALSKANYIFLAIPLSALSELVREINIHALDDVVVIDCCSARVPAERLLEKLHCKHFGIHDLKSGEYCITGKINSEMSDFFYRNKITTQEMSAEEHDKINSIIGVGHFIGLSLDTYLSREEREVLAGISSGSKLLALVDHFTGNESATWSETQIENEYTKKKRADLLKALNDYHDALTDGHYPFL